MRIVAVESEEQLAQVRQLFQEYWSSFGFTPCFQNFDAELAALPADYAGLWLALVEGQPAGCVALRRFDAVRGEFKRLFLRPQFRGGGRGRQLLDWVIAQARAAGYRELVCDTMPVMEEALALYERTGFQRTGPYSDHPTPGAIFLRLALA